MPIFALITEGLTDQAIIENLLIGHYHDQLGDDIDFIYAQPLRDETDKARQASYGGWEQVLEFCSSDEDIFDILARSDFVIVQIDTDCAGHQNFGVNVHSGGSLRPTAEIILDTQKLIESKIPINIFNAFSQKLIYAVSVHSAECWLLPLHGIQKNTRGNEVNCERKLAYVLSKARKNHLIEDSRHTTKGYEEYLEISKDLTNPGAPLHMSSYNDSLASFVGALPKF